MIAWCRHSHNIHTCIHAYVRVDIHKYLAIKCIISINIASWYAYTTITNDIYPNSIFLCRSTHDSQHTHTHMQPYINPQMYREHKIPPKLAHIKTRRNSHTKKHIKTHKLTYVKTRRNSLIDKHVPTHKNTSKLTHRNTRQNTHVKRGPNSHRKTRPNTHVQTHTSKRPNSHTEKHVQTHTEIHVVSTALVAQPMWETVLWQAVCGCKDRKASCLWL